MAFSTTFGQDGHCGTDEYMQQKYAENPGLETAVHEHMMRRALDPSVASDRSDECIIPVVVHVIHAGGEGNISMEQIESAIDMLNEDFNLLNPDLADVRNTSDAPFFPVATDIEITFELAKIDPNGDCTNGVERRYSPDAAFDATDEAKFYATGGLDAWPRSEYMNIWVVNSIYSSSGGIINGYAQFPYDGGDAAYGVIIRHPVFGDVGTGTGVRTLAHEIGHCLGLFHTFQSGCHSGSCDSNGDYVCDTPPVDGPQWSCVPTQNTCDDIPSGDFYGFDVLDQFENLMSYSPCRMMLTQGQKDVMDYNIADIGFLSSLTSEANAIATGVGTEGVACAADFKADDDVICAGSSVEFTDYSYHNISSWNWTFEGGSPASSTDPNPTVTYNTGGVYSVTLEVSDGTTTTETTYEDLIMVLDNPGETPPYKEGFEDITAVPDYEEFLVENDNGGEAWEIASDVVCFGDNCIKLGNFGNSDESKDAFISAPIDLSGVEDSDDIIFDFQYAYNRRFDNNNEELRFYVSKDCGETWILRKLIKGDDLSETIYAGPYEPESIDEWQQVNITTISSTYYVSNFMFKFEFTNDNGNNIYVDHINLYPASMAGLVDSKDQTALTIYPNPTESSVQLFADIQEEAYYEVVLLNNLGQIVDNLYAGQLTIGTNKLDLSLEGVPAGMYTVQLRSENKLYNQKLIKQ